MADVLATLARHVGVSEDAAELLHGPPRGLANSVASVSPRPSASYTGARRWDGHGRSSPRLPRPSQQPSILLARGTHRPSWLLHQTSFLHFCFLHRTTPGWARSARLLVRVAVAPPAPEEDGESLDADDSQGYDCTATWQLGWEDGADTRCQGCGTWPAAAAVGTQDQIFFVAEETPAGATLLSFYGPESPAFWPSTGRRWAPAPRSSPAETATARWIARLCSQCGRRRLDLTSDRHLCKGQEVAAAPSNAVIRDPCLATNLRIHCDGSYRGPGAGGGAGHVGAAAIAKRDGRVIATLTRSLPDCGSAVEAEGHGVAVAGGIRDHRPV